MPTIETAAIAAYLDARPDLNEERVWYQRDPKGPWHAREGCTSRGKVSRGDILRRATLLAGSGRVCFTCGSALLNSHPNIQVREGWVTAGALSRVDLEMESVKGAKCPDSLGKAYASSLNALWTLEDLAPNGEHSSRVLARLEAKALSLQSSTKRKLKPLRAAIAGALARAANLPEGAAVMGTRKPGSTAAIAVATGLVNFQEAWEENSLVAATLGAWPSLITSDRSAAVSLLPPGVSRSLAALELPWLSRVDAGSRCSEYEDLRTAVILWQPNDESSAHFSLVDALEAARALSR